MKKRRRRGRPSKATPALINRVLSWMAKGMTKEMACSYCGISRSTFSEWERRPEFPDLRARCEGVRFADILAKAEAADFFEFKKWAWFLERRYPKQFGPPRLSVNFGAEATVEHTVKEIPASRMQWLLEQERAAMEDRPLYRLPLPPGATEDPSLTDRR
jgi:hypothetical protein